MVTPSQRPSFLRSESNRRWTVAVADVPDDMLVAELDRLRKMGMRAGEVHGVRPLIPFSGEMMVEGKDGKLKVIENGAATIVEEVEEDEIEWGFARRAILCCRELVRTERSYQARLQDLFDGNVRILFVFPITLNFVGIWTELDCAGLRRGPLFDSSIRPRTHFRLKTTQLALFGRPFGGGRIKCLLPGRASARKCVRRVDGRRRRILRR